jgi:hypothetical protein
MSAATITLRTLVDQWEIIDPATNATFRVAVEFRPETGMRSLPALELHVMGRTVSFEPRQVERWVGQAARARRAVYFLQDESWSDNAGQFVKIYLVRGHPLTVRVEVKVHSHPASMTREYALPFTVGL